MFCLHKTSQGLISGVSSNGLSILKVMKLSYNRQQLNKVVDINIVGTDNTKSSCDFSSKRLERFLDGFNRITI
jgi:hypothetical protein